MHLDNTFANPEYDFPSRSEAYRHLKEIVEKHKKFRVFIYSYNLGKEEVYLNLADDFETLIVVDEERMSKIKLMDLNPEKFTLDPTQGWIYMKNVKDLRNGGDDIE